MAATKIPKDIFKRYPGKQVVFVDNKVVAVSKDAVSAYSKAKKKFPDKKISIFSVPRKEDKYLLV